MSITCKLCLRVFEKLISSTHLKHCHQITSAEYKKQFGNDSLASPDYRAERSRSRSGVNNSMYGKTHSDAVKASISEKNTGKIPHNKGQKITDLEQLETLRQSLKLRDERYKETGYHPRRGKPHSEATKKVLSDKGKEYAVHHAELLSTRAMKAVTTKKDKNYDFGSPMRGKHHTDQTRNKIKESSIQTGAKKQADALIRYGEYAVSANVKIVNSSNNSLLLECQECHNPFSFTTQYLTESKFRKDICPYCREIATKSHAEIEILDFVRSIVKDAVLSGNRSKIFPLELDIYIPSLELAIEYCGLYWHSELLGKNKDYHLNKVNQCRTKGIRLITIFEDEWFHSKEIVKSRLAAIIGRSEIKIGARKCTIQSLDNKTAKNFCQDNHIQGKGSAFKSYGLFYKDQLVSVMTFTKPNISKGARSVDRNIWEINRYCSLINYNVAGGASRLFAKFINDSNPDHVISYSDLRWSAGGVYNNLGFKHSHQTPPSYWYIDFNLCKRKHRFALRKNKQDDVNLTEWQNRQNQGWNRIWDCGNDKWIWSKK